MSKKIILLFVVLFSLFGGKICATHLMGGEITWICKSNGLYVFHMKIYRDCNTTTTLPPAPLILETDVPGLSSGISLNLDSATDNSPHCKPGGNQITCTQALYNYQHGLSPIPGAVEEFVYTSAPIQFPNLTPPAAGWAFWWTSQARNIAIVNLSQSQAGFTLRAKMYAYQNRFANPCYDSSPRFYEIPRTVICTGYPFVFNHNAVDDELDSLVYDWDFPLNSNTIASVFNAPQIQFQSPYTFDHPLPGPSQNASNVGVVLDHNSGEVSYTSYTSGTFVFVIKVSAYKCGEKIAEIFRDIQVVLGTCPDVQVGYHNNPPILTPPFIDHTTGLHSFYNDTVYAGQSVQFIFNGRDLDADQNFVFQQLSLSASGLEFDPTYSNANGPCLHPPCATLSPSPLSYFPFVNYADTFRWQTSCSQLGFNQNCRTFSNVYHFVFKFTDDYCPIPGISTATVTIVILPPPLAAPPHIRCVSVLPSGDVTLNWVPGVDTAGSFRSYYIYYSTNQNGPFTYLDSIGNISTTSYTHVGANADNQPAYYRITVKSGCDNYNSADNLSDTVQTMRLSATNTGTGFAHLTWNSIHDPLIPTNHPYYYIYREYPPTIWSLIDSVGLQPGTLTYEDPITICNDTVRYRVEVQDSSGCRSVSSIGADLFQDRIPPFTPELDSVSMDANSFATVAWKADTSLDTYAYVILTLVSNAWTPIDTVYGINNTFYSSNLDASLQSVPFRILAIDSCQNPSAPCIPQNTVFLSGLLDVCSSSITLSWNAYRNWPDTVSYDIYASENGGPVLLIDHTNQTTYLHTHLTQNANYCYFVRANDATSLTRTSTSNQVCIKAHILIEPNFSYIHTATITGDNQVTIRAYVDTAADIMRYKILRAETRGGFSVIASVPANPLSPNFSYTDFTAKTSERSYFYKVIAVDSCNQDAFTSEVARTIYLTAIPNDDISNTLDWNDYEVWLGGVDHYLLYRSVDDVPDGVINAVAFGSGHVIDNVSDKIYSRGTFCYYVEAFEGSGDMFGFSDTSRSNKVCVDQKPIVFVPNAFRPGSGVNNEFNPFKSFTKGESFNMDIYNRWGEIIFHSSDPKKGWDGTYKGKLAPDGVYVYFFKVTGTDNTDIERKGTLTLIR